MSASSKHLFELTGEHEFAVDPLVPTRHRELILNLGLLGALWQNAERVIRSL